jgi:2-polyprenyl-3-methyl-5-hydroxy-6-metoxy-1,4-benzoquinol methylase
MNHFDNLQLDLDSLFESQEARLPRWQPSTRSTDGFSVSARVKQSLRYLTTRLLIRQGWYERLIHANLILGWFDEFRRYWITQLGNRSLNPHEFHFLAGTYRARFQGVAVDEGADGIDFLDAWRDARVISQIFSYTYKLALYPLFGDRFVKYIPKNGNFCEYGCGLAPITTTMLKFHRGRGFQAACADIPHMMFHAMRWKFSNYPFIHTIKIDPADNCPLDDQYDTVFCMTVLEHLPRPMPITQHILDHIKPGGYFIFDYIKSEGKGLDTIEALRGRDSVLNHISKVTRVVEGNLNLDGNSVGIVVAQKL